MYPPSTDTHVPAPCLLACRRAGASSPAEKAAHTSTPLKSLLRPRPSIRFSGRQGCPPSTAGTDARRYFSVRVEIKRLLTPALLAWHEQAGEKRPKYLFKLKLTSNVRRAIARVSWPLWEGVPTVGCQQLAETTVKLHGWSRERRIVIVRTLKPTNPTPQDLFWDTPEDEVAASVTNLEMHEARPEQVALLYAPRADTENVFDELKNQGGFRGYCSKRAVVTELAARLVMLTCNLWSLFTRLRGLNPGHPTEAIKSRRDFLFMAAQGVQSGRQRTVKLAVKAEWWTVLKACYERRRTGLATTAPQLESQGDFLRRRARQATEDPLEWLAQPAPTPTG